MARARVKLNHAGMRGILNSAEARADLTRRAQRVLAAARGSAPVVTGRYRDSLQIIQSTTDRAVVRVAATAPHAHLVERRHGVLARAMDAAAGGA